MQADLLLPRPGLRQMRKLSQASASEKEAAASEQEAAQQLAFVNRVRPKVEAFCGDCHVMPRPTSSRRDDWTDEVNQGFMLYGTSGRTDLEVPPYDEVLKFFQYQAPEASLVAGIDSGLSDDFGSAAALRACVCPANDRQASPMCAGSISA